MKDAPTIAQQIAALSETETDTLVAEYAKLFGRGPRSRNRHWLVRKLSFRIQELKFGGLSAKVRTRLDELISHLGGPLGDADRTVTATLPSRRKPDAPPVGTTLTREWRGRRIVVRCCDNGYEHDGVLYRSLTAVATAVTGSHWNGRLFFGLVDRRKKAS